VFLLKTVQFVRHFTLYINFAMIALTTDLLSIDVNYKG